MMPRIFHVVVILGLFLVLASCGKQPTPLPKLGIPELDDSGQEVPPRVNDIILTDHQGQSFNSKDVKNKIWVVNTFFTSCPTICPKMTDNIVPVFDQFRDEPVLFSSFTVNPVVDTPARLEAFMTSHAIPIDENWRFLTGSKDVIYDFALHELFLTAMDEGNVTPDFIHSEKVVLIDRNRFIRGYYTGTDEESMKTLTRDIHRLLDE